jgi:hypothetical protein
MRYLPVSRTFQRRQAAWTARGVTAIAPGNSNGPKSGRTRSGLRVEAVCDHALDRAGAEPVQGLLAGPMIS